jgi:hypothetical protein
MLQFLDMLKSCPCCIEQREEKKYLPWKFFAMASQSISTSKKFPQTYMVVTPISFNLLTSSSKHDNMPSLSFKIRAKRGSWLSSSVRYRRSKRKGRVFDVTNHGKTPKFRQSAKSWENFSQKKNFVFVHDLDSTTHKKNIKKIGEGERTSVRFWRGFAHVNYAL